jgi:hypothetical protein
LVHSAAWTLGLIVVGFFGCFVGLPGLAYPNPNLFLESAFLFGFGFGHFAGSS